MREILDRAYSLCGHAGACVSRRAGRAVAVALLVAQSLTIPAGPVRAEGTDLWVDAACASACGQGTIDGPFPSVTAAVAAVAAAPAPEGEQRRIFVRPATYTEPIGGMRLPARTSLLGVSRAYLGGGEPDLNGEAWGGLVRGTVAVNGDDVRVAGLAIVPGADAAPGRAAVYVEEGVRVRIEHNLMDGIEVRHQSPHVIGVESATGPVEFTVEDNLIRNMSMGVYLNSPAAATIDANELIGNSHNAIGLDTLGDVVIERNTISGNVEYGIELFCVGQGSRIRRNLFDGNVGPALAVRGSATCDGPPQVDAPQNWWGHVDGPLDADAAPAPPGDVDEAQADLARERIQGVAEDAVRPWCRSSTCALAPVRVQGAVIDFDGESVEAAAATVEVADDEGVVLGSASTGDGGAYDVEFEAAWDAEEVHLQASTSTPNVTAPLSASLRDAGGAPGDETVIHPRIEGPTLVFDAAPGKATLEVSPEALAVGGNTATVTMQPRDFAGNPVPGPVDGDVDLETDPEDLTVSDATAHDDGTFTWTLSSPVATGAATLSAEFRDTPIANNAQATFLPGPAHELSALEVPGDAVAGATLDPFVVELRDEHGNVVDHDPDPDTEESLSVGIDPASNEEGATLSGTTSVAVDWTDGTATFADLAIARAGDYDLLVAGLAPTAVESSVVVAPDRADAATSEVTIAVPERGLTADGISSATVTVALRDAFGNDVTASDEVVCATTDLGTLSSPAAPEGCAAGVRGHDPGTGVFVTSLRSTSPGTATVGAFLNGEPLADHAQAAFRARRTGTPDPLPTEPAPEPSPTATPAPTEAPGPAPVSSPSPGEGPAAETLPATGAPRLSGSTRAGTAAALSATLFSSGADTVFLATSGGFADSLAGGPAAARLGGPVLLVERERIPDDTLTEMERLGASTAVLLGGENAISETVRAQVAAVGAEVDRLAGSDRFATAAAISAAASPEPVSVVYIGSGAGFADAISGGAAAAVHGGPVLLVSPGRVPNPTVEELRRLAPQRIVVLGGTAAVSPAVQAELAGFAPVERLSGPDRYATSAAIAAAQFPREVDTVFVATGEDFPDALAAVPAASRLGAPLLLVGPDGVSEPVATQLSRLRPRRIVVLGGPGAVAPQVQESLAGYAEG